MRWLVGEFMHETNTFSNILPGREEFQARELFLGQDIPQKFRGTRACMGGIVDFIDSHAIDAVWTIAAFTTPAGRVQDDFYDWAKRQLLEGLKQKVDGVMLSLHGAMCSASVDGGDGDVLREIRRVVGHEVPIAACLDFHANVSAEMAADADILVGYKTYPHVDNFEAAYNAAELLFRTLNGEVRPVVSLKCPPMLVPLGNTQTSREPMLSIMDAARQIERRRSVLSASVFGGFPYADVEHSHASTLVVTDSSQAAGNKHAADLAQMLWDNRHALLHKAPSVAEAVRLAMKAKKGPVVLADIADNPGGGGAGDGVEILRELLAKKAPSASVGPVWDPQAVEVCRRAGVGEEVTLDLGAHTDDMHGRSVKLRGKIIHLGDGKYVLRGPMMTGVVQNMGPCAAVRSGGVDVVICSSRVQHIDPQCLRSVGIEPTEKRIVAVKSSIHYRAAYEPLAAEIIEVDAPGLVCQDLTRFDFRKVRRPIFPLDKDIKADFDAC